VLAANVDVVFLVSALDAGAGSTCRGWNARWRWCAAAARRRWWCSTRAICATTSAARVREAQSAATDAPVVAA
jgi:hypothetical protein